MSQKVLLFFASLLLSTTAVGTAGTAQAGPINWAQVIKLVNKVQFKPTNAGWRPAQGQDRLQQAGEALFTSRGSRADLRLSEGSLLRMSSNTHLWIQPNSRNLLQRSGTALYVIKPGGGSTLISTPYGRAGVRGSALFVRVNEQTGTMIVGALTNNPAGDMEITTENGPKQLLKAGQMAVVRGGTITTFEFDLNTFYQTSSLVQGFGLDGKPLVDSDGSLADPEVQQTLAAVQAETLPALAAQAPVSGSNVAINPEFLNSSPRDLKPVDLVMQATTGNFDRNSPQTAAGLAAVRQGINPPAAVSATTIAAPPAIPPAPIQAPTVIQAPVGAPTGTIVPLPNNTPPPTAGVNPTPTVVTPTVVTPTVVTPTVPTPTVVTPPTAVITPPTAVDPGRTTPNNTPAIPTIQPIGQPNNPQLPVIQPITQPNPAGSVNPTTGVNPTPISQPNPAGQVAPPIRVEIRVEIEKWSYPSKVETPRSTPTPTPAIQAPIVAPVVPTPTSVTAPIVPTPPASTTSVLERTTPTPTPSLPTISGSTTPSVQVTTPPTVGAPIVPMVERLPVVEPITPLPTPAPTTQVAPPTTLVAPPTTQVAPPTTLVAPPIAPVVETLPVVAPIILVTPTPTPIVPVAAPTPVTIPDRAIPTAIPATLPTTPDPTLTVPQ
jgi:FecR protein